MKVKHIILIGLALLLAHPLTLQAQIPRTISYQGVLTDASGNIKPDGPYTFTFRLYDVSSGGTDLWTETATDTVKDGLFSTTLGDQTGFPPALTFDRPYWLGIQVESEELAPRIALTSSPYSFSALRADTAAYIPSIMTSMISDNAITSEKIADGTITRHDLDDTDYYVVQAIYAKNNNSSGNAGDFRIYNTDNTIEALIVRHHGLGEGGDFGIENTSNDQEALTVRTKGVGKAASFSISNTGSSADVLSAGTSGSGYAGKFNGSVWVVSLVEGSDIRWKQNIKPLRGALDKVLRLQGTQFEWNLVDYPDKGFREGQQIGLIAQEVAEVLPELVRTDQDGYKAVDYQKITAVLVEAIKDQQKQIEALKAAVLALQAQSDVALQK